MYKKIAETLDIQKIKINDNFSPSASVYLMKCF
jgi:hypothetical protein